MKPILLILIPFIGGCIAWAAGHRQPSRARWISLAALVVACAPLVALFAETDSEVWITSIQYPWIPHLGIGFDLAADGISLLLITLTLVLGLAAVAVSWTEIQERVGFFHFNLLTVISGVIGVFLATDLVLFYVFWEVMLIPMYFLIAIWGHENRAYAALKFFIFTQAGSLFMLFSILALSFTYAKLTGIYTFDYFKLLELKPTGAAGFWMMLGFLAAFAVKLPAFLVHTWLPDAHTEAPTAGSVLLAGLLLKTGGYGLIRFALPLFPEASVLIAPAAMLIGVAGIIYGAIMAFAQDDMKRLIAYSSVSHLGFVLVGVYAFNETALQGAVLQMLSHGLSTGALFMIAGMLQERIHTRDMNRMGGLWSTAPIMGGAAMLCALASLGLPGTGNFNGEFLVLAGSFGVAPGFAAAAALGLALSAVYSLWMMYRVFFGEKAIEWRFSDLSSRETVVLSAMIAGIIWLGTHPAPVIRTAEPCLTIVEARMKSAHAPVNSDVSRLAGRPRNIDRHGDK